MRVGLDCWKLRDEMLSRTVVSNNKYLEFQRRYALITKGKNLGAARGTLRDSHFGNRPFQCNFKTGTIKSWCNCNFETNQGCKPLKRALVGIYNSRRVDKWGWGGVNI